MAIFLNHVGQKRIVYRLGEQKWWVKCTKSVPNKAKTQPSSVIGGPFFRPVKSADLYLLNHSKTHKYGKLYHWNIPIRNVAMNGC